MGVGVGVGGGGSASLHAFTPGCPEPPTVTVRVLTQLIGSPSGTSGPLPETVRGPGMGRPAESVPGLVPDMSQTSPMPSPTSSPAAFMSSVGLVRVGISGQLSPLFGKPSPSWSVGCPRRAARGSGVGSQVPGCRRQTGPDGVVRCRLTKGSVGRGGSRPRRHRRDRGRGRSHSRRRRRRAD